MPGRVVLEHNHVYRVLTQDGELLAESAGSMRHRAEGRHALPVVGDWVALRVDPGGRSQIREVLPRRSRFSRKAAGRETEEQVIAANIETVFIVFGLDGPVKPRAIERYLVVAKHSGADPVVVLNKIDLVDDEVLREENASAEAVAGGAVVLQVSTKTGAGMDRLSAYLSVGRTAALIGPSGAGKSSIVNGLVGREVLPTGEVRPWDARGRHTSVHRQLVVREAGGMIIDTPGMREVQLWEPDALEGTFAEIDVAASECKFRDCRHETEPGCAVKAAVERGEIAGERYEGFLKLQHEQETVTKLRDERALAEQKRQSKVQHRALRALYKHRQKPERS